MAFPAMINCDRDDKDNNNMKIVSPNKNDIGEMSFKEFAQKRE
jgi:hypothetical protein